jgi:hypothetical protein
MTTDDAKKKEPCLKCDDTGWVWINDPREEKPQPRHCPAGCKPKEKR